MQPKKPDSLTKLLQKKQKIEQQISNAKTRRRKWNGPQTRGRRSSSALTSSKSNTRAEREGLR